LKDKSVNELVDFLVKLNIIDYRLRKTDEILDGIGRKWKMEQFNQDNFIPKISEDPNGEHVLSDIANKKFSDWKQTNEMLFHVLVVNLYNLNESIKNLKKIEHSKLKQIHESMKPCLDALENKERQSESTYNLLYNNNKMKVIR